MPTPSERRIGDIRRIAFVTQRFGELQGLRTVADALPAVIFAAGLRWVRSNLDVMILFGALATYFALRVTWIRSRIESYYSRRLGRVEPSVVQPDPALLFRHFHRPARVDGSRSNSDGVFLFYQGLITAPMARDIHLPVFVQIVIVGSMLGFLAAQILTRDWRYRAHWLLPLGVAAAFALGLTTVASARDLYEWQTLACLCGGVALAIAGVCDHLLLVESLGGAARAESMAQHADIH